MGKIEITVRSCSFAKWAMEAVGIIADPWLNPFASDQEVEDFLTEWLSRNLPKNKVENCVQSWKEFCESNKQEFTWSS